MEHDAGIDVSLEQSSVCVVDGTGRIVAEAKVRSEPEALVAWLTGLGVPSTRVGLEAGPLSQWLHAGMRAAGLPADLLETRHVRTAFETMPVKTDRKDARGIAQLTINGAPHPIDRLVSGGPLHVASGMRKAKVALARELAVILHRMLVDGTTFDAGRAAAAK